MGKSGRWLRRLLGGKKTPTPDSDGKPPKKKWSFVGSFKDKERAPVPAPASEKRQGSYWEGCCNDEAEQNKHAIAVAAATAAVAEAAVAAAQAAAAVVRLTSSGPYGGARREDLAALRIQTAFRGYLARRALRALKGLVKLQALVRGLIIRKQAAETLRCMQVLVRVQTRARANRALFSNDRNLTKPIPSNTGHETREKEESTIRVNKTKRDVTTILKGNTSQSHIPDAYLEKNQMGYWNHFNRRMDNRAIDDGNNDKILEIDTGRQSFISNRKDTAQQSRSAPVSELPDSPSKDSTTAQISNPSPSSVEMQALSPLRFTIENDDSMFDTAANTPQFYSASSSRRGPFTPSKSECSRSFLCHPSYMSNTESSRAKVRSQSAPKQRPEFEKPGSTKQFSVNGIGDVTATGNVERSSLQIRFTRKAYPGSGRLDRLGMPVNR